MKQLNDDDTLRRFHYRLFYECTLQASKGSKMKAKQLFKKVRAYYDGLVMFYQFRSYVSRATLHYFNFKSGGYMKE